MIIGHLNITSYRGISLGAVHYYAELQISDKNKEIEEFKLHRPMLAKEAMALNAEWKSQGYAYSMHKPGELTEGFTSEFSAIHLGIKTFKKKYPKGILFRGDNITRSAWKNVIYFPPEFKDHVAMMELLAKEFQSLNGYECKPHFKKLVNTIDKSWYDLYCKLEKL